MTSSEAFDMYEGMLVAFREEIRAIKKLKCHVHKKPARLTFDYDLHGIYAHVTKCCCPQHAEAVAEALYETVQIDKVILHQCDNLSTTVTIRKPERVHEIHSTDFPLETCKLIFSKVSRPV